MPWHVLFDDEFAKELTSFDAAVQAELLAHAGLLKDLGPNMGRPRADTLRGSKHFNMKELRFKAANGVWRVAFAFDPVRRAIVLTAGDKAGASQKRFYKRLISIADTRFDSHLARLKEKGGKQ